MAWSLDALTTAGFALGILLMVVTAGSAFTFAKQMLATNKSINRRQEILEGIQRGMTGMAELPNSQRVYVNACKLRMQSGFACNPALFRRKN